MKLLVFIYFVNLINGYSFRRTVGNYRNKNLNSKIYIIDIDGTICYSKDSNYNLSKPRFDMIEKFNKLYEDGNDIHYWTARGAISEKNWDKFTIQQLNNWGVKYTSINMDKPHYDYWIDDKAINVDDLHL